MKNKNIIIIVLLVLLIGGIFIFEFINDNDTLKSSNTSTIDINVNKDDGDEDIDWSIYDEKIVSSLESIKITEGGIYNLSGTINGNVTVNTTSDVKLILNNVIINSLNGPAIIIEEANNTAIYLNEGTVNTLNDSKNYNYEDLDINGVIYSKDDLIFDGAGTLNINGNYQEGIVSKDDLKIINGIYNIKSIDDGIRGKDSINIINGNFNIISGGDGLKSTNDTDDEKGYILIQNGSFVIEAELDGIQAERKLIIEKGSFKIKTGGGSVNSSSSSSDWGNWGRNPFENSSDSTTDSAKGLKSQDNLVIKNGTFIFDTSDDSIHSNNYVGIVSGDLEINSGDDGVHADMELIIDGGDINIIKSYEGIEASKITINGGNISIVSSDDGINVAGGNDNSASNRPGQNNYSSNINNILIINNGNVYVNSTGDGIDINGSGYMYGGTVYVEGPTSDGNGSLDYDQKFVVDGGTMIASGSSGMLNGVSSSKQYNVIVSFSNSYTENTKVNLVDSKSDEIISYTPTKSFSSIIISSPLLSKGQTYTLKINGEDYETFTISSFTTSIGSMENNMPGGNHGGHRR